MPEKARKLSKGMMIGIIVAVVILLVIGGYFILHKKSTTQSIYTCSDGRNVASPNDCIPKIPANQQDANYGEVYGNNPAVNASPAPVAHAKVEITSHNVQTIEGDYSHTIYKTIIGEVKNNGERTANGVKVIATLYDANNRIVGSEYNYAEITDLKVGQISPFKIANIETNFQTYKLQADWSEFDW